MRLSLVMLVAMTVACSSSPAPHPDWATLQCRREANATPIPPGVEFTCPRDGDFRCPPGRTCIVRYRWPAKNEVGVAPLTVTAARPEFIWRQHRYTYTLEGQP